MLRLLIVIFLFAIISGCHHDKDKQKSSETGFGEETAPDDLALVTGEGEQLNLDFINKVELGPVAGSIVRIYTIDREVILYETTTDDNGLYSLDRNLILENINNLLSNPPEFVLVESLGGVDVDPNDDGVRDGDFITVEGKVKGIIKLDILLMNEGLAINLLSTAVAELLGDDTSLTEAKLTKIIRGLGASDINSDGLIDNQDIIKYKMGNDDSDLETKLRSEFLRHIHDDTVSLVIEDLAIEFGIIEYSSIVRDDEAAVITLSSDKQVYYKLNAIKGDLLLKVYNEPITLFKNEYIVYRSCTGENTCFSTNILSFDGTSLKTHYSRSLASGFSQDLPSLNLLLETVYQKIDEYAEIEGELDSNYPKRVEELNKDIQEVEAKIIRVSDLVKLGM